MREKERRKMAVKMMGRVMGGASFWLTRCKIRRPRMGIKACIVIRACDKARVIAMRVKEAH